MNHQRTKSEAFDQFKSDVRTITNNLKYELWKCIIA